MMVVDFLSFAPYFLALAFGGAVDLRALRVLRLLRLLKIARYSQAMPALLGVLYAERRALFGAFILLIFTVCVTAEVMHLIEGFGPAQDLRHAAGRDVLGDHHADHGGLWRRDADHLGGKTVGGNHDGDRARAVRTAGRHHRDGLRQRPAQARILDHLEHGQAPAAVRRLRSGRDPPDPRHDGRGRRPGPHPHHRRGPEARTCSIW